MRRSEVAAARRRWWLVVAATVACGLIIAIVVQPGWGDRDYEATRTLRRAASQDGLFRIRLDAVAQTATGLGVATLAAERVGFDGDPQRIVERVTARSDEDAGTVAVTARRDDRSESVAVVDAVVGALVDVIDEQRVAARDRAVDEAERRARELRDAGDEDGATAAEATARDLADQDGPRSVVSVSSTVARAVSAGALSAVPPILGWTLTLLVLLAVGASLALAVDRLYLRRQEASPPRVNGVAAAEAAYGLPVLTTVPRHAVSRPNRIGLSVADSDSAVGRAHRVLYDALRDIAPAPPARVPTPSSSFVVSSEPARRGVMLLVTSAVHDEGKTDTAANLAAAAASNGRSVLIVDCELRRTDGAAGPGHPGLADLLARGDGELPMVEVIVPTSMSGVSLIPAGRPVPGDALLLAGAAALFDRLRRLADVVILHGPALLSSDEAVALAQAADASLVVCRNRFTREADAREVARRLALVGVDRTAGVVLVAAPE